MKDSNQSEGQGKGQKKDRSFYTKGLIGYVVFALIGVALFCADLHFWGTIVIILGCLGAVGMLYCILNPNWEAKASNSKQVVAKPAKVAKQTKTPQTQVPARVGYRPAPDKMKISAAEYIVIDVETTGLSPDDDRIIEVAAVKCENDRIVDSFHSLINPGRRIPSNVTKLTGIKNADVAGAPDMDTVAPELSEFIDNLPLVAHNANFDIKFISNAFKRAGVSKGMLYIDTLALARNAYPNMPNHKLSTLINELGLLDHEQEHRAMSDVEATQRLYMVCKAQLVRQ